MAFEVNSVPWSLTIRAGLAAPGDERRQFPRDAATRDRGIDHGGEAFLHDVVDHIAAAGRGVVSVEAVTL